MKQNARNSLLLSLVLVSIALFQSVKLQAAHVSASEISYTYLSSGIYEIRLVIARDCNGIPLNPLAIGFRSNGISFTQNLNDTVNLIGVRDITGIPTTCPVKNRCVGSYIYGFEEYTYLDTVDLSSYSNCEWDIDWQICCRNGNITTGSSGQNFYNYARLNKCIKNNSPFFNSAVQTLQCHGLNSQLSFAVNPNNETGDSFSYHLVTALQDSGSPTSYNGSWNATRPLTFLGFPNSSLSLPAGFHIDAQSGLVSFRPTQINQVAVICVEVREWRTINGTSQLIGKVRRDMQVVVISCPNNTSPYIDTSTHSGSSITIDGSERYEVCIKDSFCFDIHTGDTSASSSDSTFIYYVGSIPGAQFSSTNGAEVNATGTFCWVPLKTAVSNTPYVFSVEVYDHHCPFPGKVTRNYLIYIRDSMDGVNVDAGPDRVDSTGLDSFSVSGSLIDYSGQNLRWTTNGDGYFSAADSQSTKYYPGPLDRKKCNYQLYFEAIDSTPCLGNSKLKDTLIVSHQMAFFDAGTDRLFFPGDTLGLNPSIDTGRAWSFYWQALGDTWLEDSAALFGKYSPGANDILNCSSMLILHAMGCDTLADTLRAIRDYRPMDAGIDLLFLDIDQVQLEATLPKNYDQKGFWRSTGKGVFSDSTDPRAIYQLDALDRALCKLEFIWQELPESVCRLNADTVYVDLSFSRMFAGNDSTIGVADTAFLSAWPQLNIGKSGVWSSSGDGSFSDLNDPKAIYLPGPIDKRSCRTLLIWSFPYSPCSLAADTLTLSFSYTQAFAGPNRVVFYGDSVPLAANKTPLGSDPFYWTTTGDGYFSDTLDPLAIYYPGNADWMNCGAQLIWNSPYGLCANGNDTMYWNLNPFFVEAGSDISELIIDSLALAASPIQGGRVQGWWTSTGSGIFSDSTNPNAIYYPSTGEKQSCEGKLYWHAPFTVCTSQLDSITWKRKVVQINAGANQTVNLGKTITLQATSGANRVIWTSNGYGRFLDSSAKATLYYPDSLDFPLCSLKFHLQELEAPCSVQADSLQVFWKEEGLSVTGLKYDVCFMDSIQIIIQGNQKVQWNWQTTGTGTFVQDQVGNWYYKPSNEDYSMNGILLTLSANGYCFSEHDSVYLPIAARNQQIQNVHQSGPITVYPNPTKDWLTIMGNCPVNLVSAELFDMRGRSIQFWQINELPYTLSIESLAPAVYMLRIKLAGGRELTVPVTKYAE